MTGPAATMTVLVVDDEAHITQVVGMKLGQSGLSVLTASDGVEAMAVVKQRIPDLVVTDFQMPRMSGYELAVALRQYEPTANIPVLMITARGHMISPGEIEKTNIRAVMCKPFSPRHVLEKVHAMLGMSPQARGAVGGAGAGTGGGGGRVTPALCEPTGHRLAPTTTGAAAA